MGEEETEEEWAEGRHRAAEDHWGIVNMRGECPLPPLLSPSPALPLFNHILGNTDFNTKQTLDFLFVGVNISLLLQHP